MKLDWKSMGSAAVSSLKRDWPRKVIALFFACLIYVAVSSQIGKGEDFFVPVDVKLSSDLVDTSPKEYTVTLKVTGSKSRIANLNPQDLKGEVQVNQLAAGQTYTVIKLEPEMFRCPFGCTIKKISPRELKLKLERSITREIPVEAQFSRSGASPDYRVGGVTFMPATVKISGPESIVKTLKKIKTSPIPLNQIVESFEYPAGLALPDKVTAIPDQVQTQVQIVKSHATRIFTAIPLYFLSPVSGKMPGRVEPLSTPRVEVAVSGLRKSIEQIKPEMLKPYVDLSQLSESGICSLDVFCGAPGEDTVVKSIYPKKIQVKITK